VRKAAALPALAHADGDLCPLPRRWLRMSRGFAAAGGALLLGGLLLVFLGGPEGPVLGSLVGGLGLGLLLSAGYYWGCGTKGCV
jgi:hypothetical protein